jgi:hypothetical protein
MYEASNFEKAETAQIFLPKERRNTFKRKGFLRILGNNDLQNVRQADRKRNVRVIENFYFILKVHEVFLILNKLLMLKFIHILDLRSKTSFIMLLASCSEHLTVNASVLDSIPASSDTVDLRRSRCSSVVHKIRAVGLHIRH